MWCPKLALLATRDGYTACAQLELQSYKEGTGALRNSIDADVWARTILDLSGFL